MLLALASFSCNLEFSFRISSISRRSCMTVLASSDPTAARQPLPVLPRRSACELLRAGVVSPIRSSRGETTRSFFTSFLLARGELEEPILIRDPSESCRPERMAIRPDLPTGGGAPTFFALGERPLATFDSVSAGCTSLRASRSISARPAACLSAEHERSCSGDGSREREEAVMSLSTLLTFASPVVLACRSITSSVATLPSAALKVTLRGLVAQSQPGAWECCGAWRDGPPGHEVVDCELSD
mmetsp:Transcript_79812/g.145672  ORF Transcript_79812/g.145672 Transcript_79812/m.145672 type:complete len:243 (-) Transcript_79812:170-898(-)